VRLTSAISAHAQFKAAQEAAQAKEATKAREKLEREVERLEKEDANLGRLDKLWADCSRHGSPSPSQIWQGCPAKGPLAFYWILALGGS
jgi:hypothetical protein